MTGSGKNYVAPNFMALYGPGQPLDTSRWYIILPDSIGHGQSSKPSDGLRARFPHYDYDDMVEAQYRLVIEGLGINHLRLVTGISMGGMHSWLWGELHPDLMDALLPLVCQPVEITGRNRMWRRTAMDAIRNDPGWNNGEYPKQPAGLISAARIFALAVSGAADLQKRAPTREQADALLDQLSERWVHADANDMLYQLDASRTYNPEPQLERIQANLIAVNTGDDFINPRELDTMEGVIKRVKRGRYVLLPLTGRGHLSVSDPSLWKQYLKELLEPGALRTSPRRTNQDIDLLGPRRFTGVKCLLVRTLGFWVERFRKAMLFKHPGRGQVILLSGTNGSLTPYPLVCPLK